MADKGSLDQTNIGVLNKGEGGLEDSGEDMIEAV